MKLIIYIKILTGLTLINSLKGQSLNFSTIKSIEFQLDDVMEIIDTTELKIKLKEVEENYNQNPNEINKTRLGIIYHETALNLSFFSKTVFKGYARKSFDVLSQLLEDTTTSRELLPFISSYRASALSLVGAETKKMSDLKKAFKLFEAAVDSYASVTYLPEFLRGSVAENLPWYFYLKRKCAKHDFQSIISKNDINSEYGNWRVMSFTYWAWANQHQDKKHKTLALQYLDRAIAIDPDYKAGRKKAEELKTKIIK
jgi:tetratricopeptide (TPR) repeat protein